MFKYVIVLFTFFYSVNFLRFGNLPHVLVFYILQDKPKSQIIK